MPKDVCGMSRRGVGRGKGRWFRLVSLMRHGSWVAVFGKRTEAVGLRDEIGRQPGSFGAVRKVRKGRYRVYKMATFALGNSPI